MTTGTTPSDRQYAKTHEWVKVEGNRATVGITDHAQSELTDIVFVDLPAVGTTLVAGKTVLSLESVKTVSDVYAPGGGRIVETNGELKAHPELINQDPYGRGWLFRFEVAGPLAPGLMDADAYRRSIGGGP